MKRNTFLLLLSFIIVIGVIFRFWNYSGRFGLAYDQAHDAIVAREAVHKAVLPLVGPFSSAGPFQTSGTWYWLLMLPTFVFPASVLSPWVFLTLASVFMVLGIGLFGSYVADETLGLIAAALTAVSTAQIAQSVNLTNQTPIPFLSLLTIVSAVWFVKSKRLTASLAMGLFASLAASIHLQGMALGIIVVLALIVNWKIFIKSSAAAIIGAIPPMLPIVLWDIPRGFINIRNMIYYYRVDQYNISLDVLGRRWLTYLNDFWPREWSHITGGVPYIALIIAVMVICSFIYGVYKRSISKEWIMIFISFMGMMVLVRYTRVPIYSSFITFAHPFVLLITAWGIYTFQKINRPIGILLFCVVLLGSVWKSSVEAFTPRQNWTAKMSMDTRSMLKSRYPNEKFAIYDYKYDEARRSVPLVLYLDEQDLHSLTGRRIGFLRENQQAFLQTDIISTESGLIADLSSSDSASLINHGWMRVNPPDIYHATEEWLPKTK